MRKLLSGAKKTKVELIDGVKLFFKNSWILLLPDTDEAISISGPRRKRKNCRETFRRIPRKNKKISGIIKSPPFSEGD